MAGAAIHLTTGSDWCLIVEAAEPHAGYGMGDSELVTLEAIGEETPSPTTSGKALRRESEP